MLPEASKSVVEATNATVAKFLAEHTEADRPELLDYWCQMFNNDVSQEASCHHSMVSWNELF